MVFETFVSGEVVVVEEVVVEEVVVEEEAVVVEEKVARMGEVVIVAEEISYFGGSPRHKYGEQPESPDPLAVAHRHIPPLNTARRNSGR
jgi:hypothetical protein